MTRLHLSIALLVACTPSLAPPGPDGPAPQPAQSDLPITARFQPFADHLQAEMAKLHAPGVAALVLEHGTVTFAHGFGVKAPGGGDPVHASTLFRIGSTTKMMTATALLQLVAAGQVGLDDPVTKALPAFHVRPSADVASSIHVRHLLEHASGLDDYLTIDGPHDDASLASYLTGAFGNVEYMMAPAGAMWNYSNPNFYLAGLLVETLGGAPYRQAIHDRVWAPLGMDRTTFLPSDVLADGDYAIGASTDASGAATTEPPDAYDNAWARPAGYAFSSVWDLSRFAQFLLAGDATVLPDAQRTAMESPQMNMQDAGAHDQYGFALFVQDYAYLADGWHPARIVQHGGDIPGFACDLYTVPDAQLAIIVLANADGAHFTDSIDFALQTYANLPPATAVPQDVLPDPSTFASLVGSYQDEYNIGAITIAGGASGLTISIPALDAQHVTYDKTLQPFARDVFGLTIDGFPDEITFLRDGSGAPVYLRDRDFVAHRVQAMTRGPQAPDIARFLHGLHVRRPAAASLAAAR